MNPIKNVENPYSYFIFISVSSIKFDTLSALALLDINMLLLGNIWHDFRQQCVDVRFTNCKKSNINYAYNKNKSQYFFH